MLACVMVSRLMSPVWTGSVVDPLWLMDPVDEVAASLLHPCFINHTNTHTDARTCTHPFITPGWSLMTESWECETKCRNRSYRCFLSFFLPLFPSSFLSFFFISSFISLFLYFLLYFLLSFHISFSPSFSHSPSCPVISRLSHTYAGPRQRCDMLRRQYKYLIRPNGNHHSVLIAPHII